MANTIRIKRRAAGGFLGAPSGLANAELAYNEGDNILYYGFGTGGVGGTATQAIPIAGSGAYLNKNNNLSDLNNTQTSRNNLASNTVTSGLFMRGNGTNVLMGSIIPSDIPTLNQNTTGNAGTVTNGVYTSRTITPGSGLAGSAALDLSADRTFNIGQGDGISVSDDSIAVDSTVVRTTGEQTIRGTKTFRSVSGTSCSVGIKADNSYNSQLVFFEGSFPMAYLGWNASGNNFEINSYFGYGELSGPFKVNHPIALEAFSTSSPVTNIPVFIANPSGSAQLVHSRTPSELKSDIGLGNVENLALSGVTFTAGSGLAGGGTLAADRTFNIGQGDGITVSTDAIAVDSTVVRTTGTQSIGGVKTFTSKPTFNDGLLVGGINRFTTGGAGFEFSIDRGYDIGFNGDILKFDVDNDNGTGYSTTLKTYGPTQNIIIRLPTDSGVLARLQDITTTNITGTLAVNKGGTGATTLTSNNILVGNGTSAISAPYSVETTLTGGASAIPRADAVKTYVDSAITSGFSTNDAMVFKGTLGSGGTVTALPTGTVSAGWSYRVITTGTYAGVVSEIGDLIIAVADANGNVNSTWTVVQTNLDGAVIGPASATDNALAVFNGATGKLIKNSSLIPTTVGSGLINLTNPGAISFLRINADSTITALSDVNFRTAIGAGTSSTVGTVTSVGGTGSTAGLTLTGTVTSAGSLTLGGTLSTPVSTINDSTTVGQNLVKLTNPSAITFLRINADNSVTSLSGSDFRTAIGAGTSSTVGTVTSIAALTLATSGTDLSSSVANGTTTPTITLNVPTASASVRGALSSTDWSTFNNKAAANQTMFIGTTSVAINRSSAALVLTGITSIDGNAATVTNGVYTTGAQTIGGAKTFTSDVVIGNPVSNKVTIYGSGADAGKIVGSTSITMPSATFASDLSAGSTLSVNGGGVSIIAENTNSTATHFAIFTSNPNVTLSEVQSRTPTQVKTDLSLDNVQNTALSTWAGSTSITTLGTIGTGTWNATTIAVNKGGTGQTSYINGELLIGNTSTSGLAKATLTQGSNVTITNGNGSITIASTDTNTATAADDILDGSNTGTQITYAPYASNQAASASPRFYNTTDNPSGSGRLNVSAYFYATRLFDNGSRVVTAATICADAGNCTWDGGDF